MIKSLVVSLLSLVFLLFFSASDSYAFVTPTFPLCASPNGDLKVYYTQGTHGIPGKFQNYTGSDRVYTLSNDSTMQCFCGEDGQGIQTNWWKVSSLKENEIQILKNQGWIYIPNGSLWGLTDAPYMAFNSTYLCKNGIGGIGGGETLGISAKSGEVLGLAATGTLLETVIFLALGISGLGLYLYLRKHSA